MLKYQSVRVLSAQLCPTICNPMDSSPPGPSDDGILQARILQCVAISYLRATSRPRNKGLPLWLSWERISLQCGRPGFDPWVGKILWRRERQPLQPVAWRRPGEFDGLCSPWVHKESDTTELLSLGASLVAQRVKCLPAMRETRF